AQPSHDRSHERRVLVARLTHRLFPAFGSLEERKPDDDAPPDPPAAAAPDCVVRKRVCRVAIDATSTGAGALPHRTVGRPTGHTASLLPRMAPACRGGPRFGTTTV